MQTSVAKQERPLRLRVSNLSITYKTPRGILHAVRNASFEAWEKESLVFIGESGCGKTTLCTSLVGMQPVNATTIFAVISLLWVLAVLPGGAEPYGAGSILGRIGNIAFWKCPISNWPRFAGRTLQ